MTDNEAGHAVVIPAEVLNVHPADSVQACVLEQGLEDGAQERYSSIGASLLDGMKCLLPGRTIV